MTIYDIADLMDLEILIIRFPNQKNRWICKFEQCDTKDKSGDPILTGTYGTGDNPTNATINYVQRIRGKILVFLPADPDRRKEINIPQNLES